MADEGAQRYEAADYEGARDLFERAYSVYPAPTLALWAARSLDKLGRLVEAEEHYAAVLRYSIQPDDPDVFRDAAREASQEIVKLRERIPTVTIQLKGQEAQSPGIEVEMDGRLIKPAMLGYPVPVDPGMRTIVVRLNQIERFRQTLSAEERGRRVVDVWLNPSVSTPPQSSMAAISARRLRGQREALSGGEQLAESPWDLQRTLGWGAIGLGAVGVAGGVITGLIASSEHDTLAKKCADNSCPPAYHDELDAFRRYRTLSTIGYVVGVAGAAAGATLLLTAPENAQSGASDQGAVSVQVGIGRADLRLSF